MANGINIQFQNILTLSFQPDQHGNQQVDVRKLPSGDLGKHLREQIAQGDACDNTQADPEA